MNKSQKLNLESPKEFLRSRRPERYSDSYIEDVREIDRNLLEYHLDTLTSKSQETDFERFARKLIKLEVCPNLLPQTGPTGGGDSKVDSETYPVAEELAFKWIIGVESQAHNERWAFAFSAKKKWTGKFRDDIQKLVETNRGYKKAFFVTNQFVRDQTRGKMEDELSKKHNIDVRIFDRTWILDRVFENHREDLAIEELNASDAIRRERRIGPLDLQRESDLDEVESRIEKSIENGDFSFVLVNDCIEAAVLSRGLEKPRIETEGRFARAEKLAQKHGTNGQKIQVTYDRMWTAVFWHEDVDEFVSLYPILEERTKDSTNSSELELQVNQWQVLFANAQDRAGVDIEAYRESLVEQLKAIANDETRPSNSLHAKSLLLSLRLSNSKGVRSVVSQIFDEYLEVARQSEGLIGFPLDTMVKCITAIGENIVDDPSYDKLHSELVEIVTQRTGEIAGSELLLDRGKKQLDADRPAEAVRSFGKAFHKLFKEESQHLLCQALFFCGCAYEGLGLLWAARGTFLWAASISMDENWKRDDVSPFLVACFSKLKWIELRLGRLPDVLAWHQFDLIIQSLLQKKGFHSKEPAEVFNMFDMVLAILLLRTDFWELKKLEKLPDRLMQLGLYHASCALQYALGQKSELEEAIDEESEFDPYSLFLKLRDQPASEEMATCPDLCQTMTSTIKSKVLGCMIVINFPNEFPFVEFAESIASAIESAFATGIVDRILAREPSLAVEIRKVHFGDPMCYEFNESAGVTNLEVRCCGFEPDGITREMQASIKENMAQLIAETAARMLFFDGKRMEKMFGHDGAIHRAIDFTGSLLTTSNTIGSDRSQRGWEWESDDSCKQYPCQRTQRWDADDPPQTKSRSFPRPDQQDNEKYRQDEISRIPDTNHANFELLSLIREPLWDKAKWMGAGFIGDEDGSVLLALIFENTKAATEIFQHWQSELGRRDANDKLRVSIIRRVSQKNPHHYRVVIGANPDKHDFEKNASSFGLMSRIQTMTPSTSKNLEQFLESFDKAKEYLLAPALLGQTGVPVFNMELGIVKQELNVKDAWEIGPNDIDAMGLLPDDDFIIPDSVKDPPVLELMKLHGFKTDLHVDKKERARERKKRQKALKKLTGKKKGRKE